MTNMYCETSTAQLGTIPTATLNVYAKDVPEYVTDADAVYIGHFVYRKQHIWSNNVLGDKTTYFNKNHMAEHQEKVNRIQVFNCMEEQNNCSRSDTDL